MDNHKGYVCTVCGAPEGTQSAGQGFWVGPSVWWAVPYVVDGGTMVPLCPKCGLRMVKRKVSKGTQGVSKDVKAFFEEMHEVAKDGLAVERFLTELGIKWQP